MKFYMGEMVVKAQRYKHIVACLDKASSLTGSLDKAVVHVSK